MLALALVFGAARWGHAAWSASRAELSFRRDAGELPELELEFFPAQLAFTAPSPPPSFGSVRVPAGTASWAVGAELVPGEAMVCYRGAGVGTGFAFVRRGVPNPPICLHAPGVLRGRVVARAGVAALGALGELKLPVSGAEIQVMGGGEHGLPLASARSDLLGRFEVQGFDGSLRSFTLRVRSPGHALLHHDVMFEATGPRPEPELVLEPAPPRSGLLQTPPALLPRSLRILARGLPGVEAQPDTHGAFVLDQLAGDAAPWLLVYGLPPGFAQLPVQAHPGQPIVIEVVVAACVRGRVLDRTTGAPLAGTLVWSGDGDPVRASDDGRFALEHLLPGTNEITAQWRKVRRRTADVVRVGTLQLELRAGECRDDCVVYVD